jgi:hypothetical protein
MAASVSGSTANISASVIGSRRRRIAVCDAIGCPAVTTPSRISAFAKYSASPSSIHSGGTFSDWRSRSWTSSCIAVRSIGARGREASMNIVPPPS